MIGPWSVSPPGSRPAGYWHQVANLEKMCDQAIRYADEHGCWPAEVRARPTRFNEDAVVEVVHKYASAGWTVGRSPTNGTITIDRPSPDYYKGRMRPWQNQP